MKTGILNYWYKTPLTKDQEKVHDTHSDPEWIPAYIPHEKYKSPYTQNKIEKSQLENNYLTLNRPDWQANMQPYYQRLCSNLISNKNTSTVNKKAELQRRLTIASKDKDHKLVKQGEIDMFDKEAFSGITSKIETSTIGDRKGSLPVRSPITSEDNTLRNKSLQTRRHTEMARPNDPSIIQIQNLLQGKHNTDQSLKTLLEDIHQVQKTEKFQDLETVTATNTFTKQSYPSIGLADVPSTRGRNTMDSWNQTTISRMKPQGQTKRNDIQKARNFKIGMTAFKARMKRNLTNKEYQTQMTILGVAVPDDFKGEEYVDPNQALFDKQNAAEKASFTYKEALKRTKIKLERMKRLPSEGSIDSLMISAYNSEKGLEWGQYEPERNHNRRPGVEAPAHSVVTFEDVSFTNTSRHAWLRKTEIEMKRAFMIKIEKEKLAKEQRREEKKRMAEMCLQDVSIRGVSPLDTEASATPKDSYKPPPPKKLTYRKKIEKINYYEQELKARKKRHQTPDQGFLRLL